MYAVLINGVYMAKDHRKIILFDNPNQAQIFVQKFYQFAVPYAASGNGDVFAVMESQSNIVIEEFKTSKYDTQVQTIKYSELK